mgnify:CR=1 FL=1
MFSFFKKKTDVTKTKEEISKPVLSDDTHETSAISESSAPDAANIETSQAIAKPEEEKKQSWLTRLKAGLARTSANLNIFGGTKIDEELVTHIQIPVKRRTL